MIRARTFSLLSIPVLAVACASSSGEAQHPVCPPTAASSSSSVSNATNAAAGDKAPATFDDARTFYAAVDAQLRRLWTNAQKASWVNENFITDDTEVLAANASEESMAYLSAIIPEARKFDGLFGKPKPDGVDAAAWASIARQHHNLKFATILPAPRDPKKRAELAATSVAMTSMYGKGKYCPKRLANAKNEKDRCLDLGALDKIISKSKKYDELLEAWTGWHAIAPPIKEKYTRYVELGNEGARELGYSDLGALWRSLYDMTPEEFEAETDRLWQQVKPLYDDLHCYMRSKLRKQYPEAKIGEKGTIPAHLLGNMWAQEWSNLYPLVEPHKNALNLDVGKKLKAKKLDEKAMVTTAEGFFTSLGLDPLPKSFWERSLFKKPADRDVVCHASAWDPSFANDLRIKMCIEIDEENLHVVHHELGHVYYYQQYNQLPMLFQDGANDGFHEAIGDTISLSVTPGYLKTIGLLDQAPKDEKADLDVLMKKALEKVAFLPFGKLIDQWRWDVFAGKIKPDAYNAGWWALRKKYQGVDAPVPRTEQDFDPGAKFHVPANTPYTRYFLAAIYQFQFHRALCRASAHTGPLHSCSIYGSKEAGAKFKALLSLGSSKAWPEALAAMSGESKADATAILEYFAPLHEWLKAQNKGETCGW